MKKNKTLLEAFGAPSPKELKINFGRGVVMSNWEKVGEIGVDAGLCWVGDPCYCVTPDCNSHPAKTWPEFCEKLDEGGFFDKNGVQQFDYVPGRPGLGVAVSTGHGDGSYNVYVKRDGNLIKEVKVVFVDEDRSDLWGDEDNEEYY